MKKERVEAEVVEEKEENFFQKLFKKAKNKIDDATFEARLQNKFNENKNEFSIHNNSSLLSELNRFFAIENTNKLIGNGHIIAYGELDVEEGSLIKNHSNEKVYHIDKTSKCEVNVEYDGVTYTRSATRIDLGKEAKLVEVIRVGDKFYLKK